jgi:exopolysaccharide production protein ExoQ
MYQFGLTRNNVLLFLVFLWFPFAVGGVDFLNKISVGGIDIQYFFILMPYLFCIVFSVKYFNGFLKNYFLFFWFFLILISTLLSRIDLSRFFQIFSLFGCLSFAYLAAHSFSLVGFLKVLSLSSRFFLIVSFLYVGAFPSESYGLVNDVMSFSSFYGQKNVYGRFLLVGLLVYVFYRYLSLNETGSNGFFDLRFFFWVALYIFGLFISASKSSLGLAIILFAMMFVFSRLKNRASMLFYSKLCLWMVPLVIVVSLMSGAVYFVNIGSALDCLSVLDYFCIPGTGRFTIWDTVIFDSITDGKVLFGYGFGYYFGYLSETYLSDIGLGEFMPHDPHNGYVEVFVSIGLLGVFFVFVSFWYFLRLASSLDRKSYLLLFLFVFLFMVSNLTESYFLKTTNVYIFLYFYFLAYSYKQYLSNYVRDRL